MQQVNVCYQEKWFLGDRQLKEAYSVRHAVFVKEQQVPESLEYDDWDAKAHHLVLFVDNQAIATGRFFIEEEHTAHLGRIAVLAPWRGRYLGYKIVQRLIAKAESLGLRRQVLGAQCYAQAFYEKVGFSVISDVFMDAGIPHVAMERLTQ